MTLCVPPKKNRKETVDDCNATWITRHRLENLFAKLKDRKAPDPARERADAFKLSCKDRDPEQF